MRGERVGQELFTLIRDQSPNPKGRLASPAAGKTGRRLPKILCFGFLFCFHRHSLSLHPSSQRIHWPQRNGLLAVLC